MSMGPARCERHDGSGMHSSAPCSCAPTVRDLADATDLSEFLVPGSLKFGSVEPRTDEQIAGRDLVCWCLLDQPCHADVLLQLADPIDYDDPIDEYRHPRGA